MTPDGVSRRSMLQLMSASVALAGLPGCRWPVEEIVPFDRRPESYLPGKIRRYATSLEVGGVVRPVVVSSFDGRPIKIEGNPDHPASGGGASALTQGKILELYDRDRSRLPTRRVGGLSRDATWDELADSLPQLLPKGAESRLAVLSRPHASPTLERAAERLRARYPALRWYEFDAGRSQSEAQATESIFGRPMNVSHDLNGARVLVDFDADLLVGHPEGVKNARAFAAGRRPETGSMNRLYAFEPLPTGTGAAADHRVPASPSQIAVCLTFLAAKLSASGRLPQPEALGGLDVSEARLAGTTLPATLEAVAGDLLDHPGESAIVLGDRYPAAAHELVQRMNLALSTQAVRYRQRAERRVERESLDALTSRLEAGEVDCLVILGGNPVFDAPADLDFSAALAKAGCSVHLSLCRDETSRECQWSLPRAHDLESWGDHLGRRGASVRGPTADPALFDGRSPAELLSLLADESPQTGHEMARETFDELHQASGNPSDGPSDKDWRRFLHDGFATVDTDGNSTVPPVGDLAPIAPGEWGAGGDSMADGLELDLRPDSKVHDGRYGNNAWLQELPEAITKLTWGNAALLGPSLANELGIEQEDIVRIETGGAGSAAVELPVYVLPGMARNTVSVALGYGRRFGSVARDVGVDAFALQSWSQRWTQRGVVVSPTGRKAPLASTQNHWAIDARGQAERERRIDALVREGTLDDYSHHPEFAQHMGLHHPPLVSLWQEREGEGHQWGMAIDLNSCIACNACVVACQAENNIPVVGKKEVGNGREMHWIRIDRYFHGDPDEAQVAHQPMACAHCEMAPCEQVCPVGATMHSTEGLNVMAYNRCVGTRYCANNCPYKVRRFNFFNLNEDVTDLEKLGENPEVTIRARGVMEKCTYCVQRIEHARIEAKNAGRELRDGDVTTACQQTCPSQAITFGDLSDPESRVSKLHTDPRAYGVLADLNTKPRTVYLARIRNPHPDLSPPSSHEASPHGGSHGGPHGAPSGSHGEAENSDHEGGH